MSFGGSARRASNAPAVVGHRAPAAVFARPRSAVYARKQ
jgi:hypothetical protein